MSELTNEPLSLRALTLQRLELIWREAERSLNGEADPRWAEITVKLVALDKIRWGLS